MSGRDPIANIKWLEVAFRYDDKIRSSDRYSAE